MLYFNGNTTQSQLICFIFPVITLLMGIIIHIIGLFDTLTGSYTLWTLWVHFSMLLLNTAAASGLLLRKRWGFYTALTIMVLFALTQLTLLFAHIISVRTIPFEIQNAGALALCTLAACCLYSLRTLKWS